MTTSIAPRQSPPRTPPRTQVTPPASTPSSAQSHTAAQGHATSTTTTPEDGLASFRGEVRALPKPTTQVDPKDIRVVGGLPLLRNTSPDRDLSAIPQASKMIETKTMKENLAKLAAAWRSRDPVFLEGPPGAGKTSIVEHLCSLTETPLRRVNLSTCTDVDDLIGRYVGGEERYSRTQLEEMTPARLERVAEEYGIDDNLAPSDVIDALVQAQKSARWVDGLIVRAMKRGECVLLDEMNLAAADVMERVVNPLFDERALVITEHRNEVVKCHPDFRAFGTGNPASTTVGRQELSAAARSRWVCVHVLGHTTQDLAKILSTTFGKQLPKGELSRMVVAHERFAQSAEMRELGSSVGDVAYTLRDLLKVGNRFVELRGKAFANGRALTDAELVRREMAEVYAGGFFDEEEVRVSNRILDAVMPMTTAGDFYKQLAFSETDTHVTIGDVVLEKKNTGHARVPSDDESRLIMTDRTKRVLYLMAKAMKQGENVLLVGDMASSKTAMTKMAANLLGQPYFRQVFSKNTDVSQIIGGYDERGWKDGMLLDAGRPENAPGIFFGDEVNLAGAAVLERLNPVLDHGRKVVLAEREGEEIKLHEGFRFVGAMNPPEVNGHTFGGRKAVSQALRNRVTMFYIPPLEDADEQKEIVGARAKALGLPEAVGLRLVDLHQWVQQGYANESLGDDVDESERPAHSIRSLLGALKCLHNLVTEGTAETRLELGEAFTMAIDLFYASTASSEDNQAILAKAKELAE